MIICGDGDDKGSEVDAGGDDGIGAVGVAAVGGWESGVAEVERKRGRKGDGRVRILGEWCHAPEARRGKWRNNACLMTFRMGPQRKYA